MQEGNSFYRSLQEPSPWTEVVMWMSSHSASSDNRAWFYSCCYSSITSYSNFHTRDHNSVIGDVLRGCLCLVRPMDMYLFALLALIRSWYIQYNLAGFFNSGYSYHMTCHASLRMWALLHIYLWSTRGVPAHAHLALPCLLPILWDARPYHLLLLHHNMFKFDICQLFELFVLDRQSHCLCCVGYS